MSPLENAIVFFGVVIMSLILVGQTLKDAFHTHYPCVDGLDEARRLADLTATLMPRYASLRSRDPRAPQNLTPIGALENRLRRELGDAVLLKRLIEGYVAGVM